MNIIPKFRFFFWVCLPWPLGVGIGSTGPDLTETPVRSDCEPFIGPLFRSCITAEAAALRDTRFVLRKEGNRDDDPRFPLPVKKR